MANGEQTRESNELSDDEADQEESARQNSEQENSHSQGGGEDADRQEVSGEQQQSDEQDDDELDDDPAPANHQQEQTGRCRRLDSYDSTNLICKRMHAFSMPVCLSVWSSA